MNPYILNPSLLPTLIGAVVVVIIVIWKLDSTKFSNFGQGLLGVASTLALATGVWAYFNERRDKPKTELEAGYTVVALAPAADGSGRALVQFVAAIQNRGSNRLKFECPALDAHGIPATAALIRDPQFQNDLQLPSLLPDTAHGREWRKCLPIERRRWLKKNPELNADDYRWPTTGFRYKTVTLEPGERKTRHFELVVPCEFAAVRFTFNVPKPRSASMYEIKKVVPLTEACEASKDAKPSAPAPSSA